MPPLLDFDFPLVGPALWVGLPTIEPTGPLRDEVLALIETAGREATSSIEAYEVFAIMVGHLHPAMSKEAHLALGVWVPDPDTGEIWAGLLLDHIVGENGEPAELEPYLSPDPAPLAPGSRVVRRRVERYRFPLGETVLLVQLEVDAADTLEVRVEFTIFPDLCRDALQLTVLSPRVEVEDILIGEGAVFMEHLTIGRPPE